MKIERRIEWDRVIGLAVVAGITMLALAGILTLAGVSPFTVLNHPLTTLLAAVIMAINCSVFWWASRD